MKSFKILKIIIFVLIALFVITFLTLINSNLVTSKIFEYASSEFPIKYSKVEGSLYTGIKVTDLNYDDMVKVKEFYIKPSLLSLLAKEIYIYDLKIDNLSFEDKFFELIKQDTNEKQEDEKNNFDIPFTLFVKNFEASLYDFVYEEQKIDEVLLKSKNISSNLKDFVSAEIFANIKSNIANLEANINIDKNSYELDSKIDLKQFIKTTFTLQVKGDLDKVDFVLKNDSFEFEKDKEILKIKDFKLLANYDINSLNLNITKINALLNYNEISSNISAFASIQNHNIDSLSFNIDLQTFIKKEIYSALKNNLQLKSNLSGNLKEIKFKSNLESNELNIDKNIIKIENAIVEGLAKIEGKNIDILADFNLKTNLANKKSKIELKLNLDKIEDLSLSAKSLVQNLNYQDLNLKQIGDININSVYKKGALSVDLNSKIANLQLKSPNFKKFDFDLHIKDLNPNDFYKFDTTLQISNIRGKIEARYERNLILNSNLILNNSFKIDTNLKTNQDNFEATVKNSSFLINIDKKENLTNIRTNISELKNLEKELGKIFEIQKLGLEGLVNLDLKVYSTNSNILENLDFKLSSPKIKFENEKIENIDIEGNFKSNTIFFDRLNFSIKKIYDIDLQKNFSLINQAFFNLDSFDGSFDFDNILLKTSKQDTNIVLKIVTKNLSLNHSLYGSGILDSNLNIFISKESKVFVKGELKANNLKAIYNIPAMSISKDKDIIIITKENKALSNDYFLENIALELLIYANDLKYTQKNIDLKASTVLNIKKEFSKDLRLYGSVSNIKGTFSELGKTYNIDNSNIYFRGQEPVNPILDISASTKVEEINIYISISGNLDNPRINLSSNPIMNQKDILSYLIFGTKFANSLEQNSQSKQSQATLFLLNELSKDYAKEIGVDMIYFQYDPSNQYIETHIGKNITDKTKVVLKNKAQSGQLIFMRELTKLWNLELGFEENTQSIDLIYKKRY